ncbi:MAG: DUF1801 domain-containing protein [Candidatus Nanopelagicales bacterium]|jgi:hypothetical protein|nr:DUF1801 domain-containing protein [Candidatus Nanopelagicales bacterium]
MQTITRLGTFADIIAGHDPAVVALCHQLRQMIIDLDPDVVEVPRAGERTAAYGLGERKMSQAYAYLAPQRGWVNLGFYHGALLPDPHGLVEGTGARIRHVKVRPNTIDEPPLRHLLHAARLERLTALSR